jgi:hypothetical protein
MGYAVFQNAGLIALLLIYVIKWVNREALDESRSLSLMAMIFYIFISVNQLMYFGLTSLFGLLATV